MTPLSFYSSIEHADALEHAQILISRFLRSKKTKELNITAYEQLILYRLSEYARGKDRGFPSKENLADSCNISLSTVKRALVSLQEKGILIVEKSESNRPYNIYVFNVVFIISFLDQKQHKKSDFSIALIESEKVRKRAEEVIHKDPAFMSDEVLTDLYPVPTDPDPVLTDPLITKQNNLTKNNIMSTSSQLSDAQSSLPDKILTKRRIEEEFRETAKKVIDFLNEKVGRNYRYSEPNLKLIIARLKSGATFIDCKQVIVKKRREWINDAKMNEYLRPATLFNATNFEQYLGELVAVY